MRWGERKREIVFSGMEDVSCLLLSCRTGGSPALKLSENQIKVSADSCCFQKSSVAFLHIHFSDWLDPATYYLMGLSGCPGNFWLKVSLGGENPWSHSSMKNSSQDSHESSEFPLFLSNFWSFPSKMCSNQTFGTHVLFEWWMVHQQVTRLCDHLTVFFVKSKTENRSLSWQNNPILKTCRRVPFCSCLSSSWMNVCVDNTKSYLEAAWILKGDIERGYVYLKDGRSWCKRMRWFELYKCAGQAWTAQFRSSDQRISTTIIFWVRVGWFDGLFP